MGGPLNKNLSNGVQGLICVTLEVLDMKKFGKYGFKIQKCETITINEPINRKLIRIFFIIKKN